MKSELDQKMKLKGYLNLWKIKKELSEYTEK